MSKFDGRTTTVKGFIIDPSTRAFDEFECEIAYTRAAEKAAKSVAEKLDVKAPKIVSVSEIVNARVEYDNAQVYNRALAVYSAESEDAKTAIESLEPNHKAININVTRYTCNAWMLDKNNEYVIDRLTVLTGGHIKRGDARAVMAMRAEKQGYKVIATHAFMAETFKAVAIINVDDLEKCVK